MKIKLFALILTALLATGCNTDSTPVDNPTNKPPVGSNPGDNPGNNPNNPGDDNPGDEDPGDTSPPAVEPAAKKVGWYLRTTAKAELPDGRTFEHTTAGVFGELDDSEDGKDRHDIASYGKAVFQVRLINDELGKDVQYFSDYRKYDGYDKKQVWTFQIKNQYDTDLSSASLKIDVEQMRNVLRKEGESRFIETLAKNDDKRSQLVLVDVDNQKTYSYSELKTANLSMDGKHTRTFRWVLGGVDNADLEPLQAKVSTLSAEQTESDFTPRTTNSTSKFGTPPE